MAQNYKGKRSDDRFRKEDARSSKKGRESTKKNSKYGSSDAKYSEGVRGTGSKCQNDPTWYYSDASTLHAYASYPFNLPAGFALDMSSGYNSAVRNHLSPKNRVIPGIMVHNFIPWFGDADQASDPINLAAQALYTQIRKANSGAKNYEPSDVMIYLMAMDSLYSLYAIMTRAYGTIQAYNPMNRYMPKALFNAQGFDFDDFIGHIADFKAFIDLTRTRISQMVVPSGMTYFTRHAQLCSNIYADGTASKSQFMVFKPEFLWKYSGYSDTRGGEVVPVKTGFVGESDSDLMTYNELVLFADELINRVVNEIDCGIISGDILKAFEGRTVGLVPMPTDYTIRIETADEWIMTQVHNAMYCGRVDEANTYIRQNDPTDPNSGREISAQLATASPVPLETSLIDVNMDSPSPELVLEATRFKFKGALLYETMDEAASLGDGEPVWVVQHAGSEVLTTFQMMSLWSGSKDMDSNAPLSYVSLQTMVDREPFLTGIISDFMVCNVTPILITYTIDTPDDPNYIRAFYNVNGVYGYLQNYTNFDLSKLRGLNTMVLNTMLMPR